MLNQIPPSRRLAILLSGIWLFLSGLFSLVAGPENFPIFDSAISFLVTWFFVGAMPIGLVWGIAWVVSGYHRKHYLLSIPELGTTEAQADKPHSKEYRKKGIEINYRKGLRRLWIIGTVAWYSYALIDSGKQIGEWVGFHYSLIEDTKSLTRAMAEKRKYEALIDACIIAKLRTCWSPPDPRDPYSDRKYLPDCEKTQAFRDILSGELKASGIGLPPAGARGEACPSIIATGVPEADWAAISLRVLAPFCLMIIYLIGRWIINGFVRHPQ